MIGYWDGYNTYGHMGDNWSLIGFSFMIIFWILIIALAILFVRHFNKNENLPRDNSHSDAITLLEGRYAKGEINTKEYEERKEVLLRS